MNTSTVGALARRDFEITRSYRLAFGFDLAWGVINLLVYFFISKIADPDASGLAPAPSYFAFAVAGIVMSLVVYATSSSIAYQVRNEQLTGTLEQLWAQPLRPAELAVGITAFPLALSVVRALTYLLIAVFALELDVPDADWPGVIVMLLAAGFAFAPIGILAAATAIIFKRATVIASAILFAMTFISGALFPISELPTWAQRIGHAMPTWFAFEGLRNALFLGKEWAGAALVLAGFAVVALPVSVVLLSASLRRAARSGTLGQY